MRLKLIAAIIGMCATLTWAFFHQVSKRETAPTCVKLYAFKAPSINQELVHTNMRHLEQEYTVVLEEQTQEASSIEYKVDTMLHAIKDNWGGVFVYSDTDVAHAQPAKSDILKALEHSDLIIERLSDEPSISSGYIACRANKKTLQLWETIKHMIDEHPDDLDHDYLASLLQKNKIVKLRWDFAPPIAADIQNSVA